MSETACCAHLRVSYQTETLPNFGTHGWWACDACPKRFAPISNTLSDGERRRPFIPIPRPEEEVRKEVLAECGYADDGPIAPTYGFYVPWVKGETLDYAAWQSSQAQQARCPECKAPLDFVTPHQPGCAWQMEQGRLAQNSTHTYGAELTNAYRPEVEMSREELKGRYPDTHTYQERFPELFPQQPEEPAPASWWSRVKEWIR